MTLDDVLNPRGIRVRLSAAIKKRCWNTHSRAHIIEFRNCTGVVEDYVDWGSGHVGPEVNVRWHPSTLRYAYHPKDLEVVKTRKKKKAQTP
jgi:hypothetical protein